MSKAVKALLRKELIRRLTGLDSLTVFSVVGVDGLATNRLRRDLRGKNIRVTVVKNSIARQALKEVGMEQALGLMEGPCAIATGGESVVSVVRQLLEHGREMPALRVKGAVMEGEVFPPERVEELSRYPTRPEALANLAGRLAAPGGNLAAALVGPGGCLAAVLKTIEQRAPKEQPAAEPAPEGQAPRGGDQPAPPAGEPPPGAGA